MDSHAMDVQEVGRVEDDITMIVGCECGWRSDEIATTKYARHDDAVLAWGAHVGSAWTDASKA